MFCDPVEEQAFPSLLTVREVAERLCVDVTTVRRWIRWGALAAVPLPSGKRRRYRIAATTLEAILVERRQSC